MDYKNALARIIDIDSNLFLDKVTVVKMHDNGLCDVINHKGYKTTIEKSKLKFQNN